MIKLLFIFLKWLYSSSDFIIALAGFSFVLKLLANFRDLKAEVWQFWCDPQGFYNLTIDFRTIFSSIVVLFLGVFFRLFSRSLLLRLGYKYIDISDIFPLKRN